PLFWTGRGYRPQSRSRDRAERPVLAQALRRRLERRWAHGGSQRLALYRRGRRRAGVSRTVRHRTGSLDTAPCVGATLELAHAVHRARVGVVDRRWAPEAGTRCESG